MEVTLTKDYTHPNGRVVTKGNIIRLDESAAKKLIAAQQKGVAKK